MEVVITVVVACESCRRRATTAPELSNVPTNLFRPQDPRQNDPRTHFARHYELRITLVIDLKWHRSFIQTVPGIVAWWLIFLQPVHGPIHMQNPIYKVDNRSESSTQTPKRLLSCFLTHDQSTNNARCHRNVRGYQCFCNCKSNNNRPVVAPPKSADKWGKKSCLVPW